MSTRPWPAERKPTQRAMLGTSPQRCYKSREERRMEIVQATLAIIAEDGLHAWTTSALAQRVGVAEATLFRHFASKDEILSAAVTHQSETLRQRVIDYQGQGTAWEELLGLVADVLAFFEETGGSPILILSGQATRISSDSRNEADATRELLRWRLMQIFRRAGCSDTDRLRRPELLADMALAVIHSTGLRWLMSGQQYPMQCQAAEMLSVLRRCLESE